MQGMELTLWKACTLNKWGLGLMYKQPQWASAFLLRCVPPYLALDQPTARHAHDLDAASMLRVRGFVTHVSVSVCAQLAQASGGDG